MSKKRDKLQSSKMQPAGAEEAELKAPLAFKKNNKNNTEEWEERRRDNSATKRLCKGWTTRRTTAEGGKENWSEQENSGKTSHFYSNATSRSEWEGQVEDRGRRSEGRREEEKRDEERGRGEGERERGAKQRQRVSKVTKQHVATANSRRSSQQTCVKHRRSCTHKHTHKHTYIYTLYSPDLCRAQLITR